TALASLLGALGIPRKHLPSNQDDRVRLWRSLLANHDANGQRMLIVLDNASDSQQIKPLLPGPGGHRVLITSRHILADLDGARLFDINVLSTNEAVEMLREILEITCNDDDRVRKDRLTAQSIAELCGGLPLAIRIVAALPAEDLRQPLTEMVEELT